MLTFTENTEKKTRRKFDLKKSEIVALFNLFQETAIDLKPSQILFRENSASSGIYYINKGNIKIAKSDSKGNETFIRNSRAGSLLGMNALMKEKKHCYSAFASEPTEVLFVSKKDFLQILSTNPVVSKYILINLCKHLEESESILEDCYFENKTRIAEAIVILLSKENDGISSLASKISLNNLSGVTGIAIEQVHQILADFKERKLISFSRNAVISADINGLKKIFKIKKYK